MATPATTAPALERSESSALRLGTALMVAGALAFVGYAVLFFIRNFTGAFIELGIGPEQVDVGRSEIKSFSPDLFEYVSHLHIAVSGFIASTALGALFLTWFGVRRGHLWAWVGAVATPVLGLAVAIPSHYPYGLATVGHLGLIYLATAVFAVGALLALKPLLRAGR